MSDELLNNENSVVKNHGYSDWCQESNGYPVSHCRLQNDAQGNVLNALGGWQPGSGAPAPDYSSWGQPAAPAPAAPVAAWGQPAAPAAAPATAAPATGGAVAPVDSNQNPFGTQSLEFQGNENDPSAKTVRLRDRLNEADTERRKAEEEAEARERAAELRREERQRKISYMRDMPDNKPAGTGKCNSKHSNPECFSTH